MCALYCYYYYFDSFYVLFRVCVTVFFPFSLSDDSKEHELLCAIQYCSCNMMLASSSFCVWNGIKFFVGYVCGQNANRFVKCDWFSQLTLHFAWKCKNPSNMRIGGSKVHIEILRRSFQSSFLLNTSYKLMDKSLHFKISLLPIS